MQPEVQFCLNGESQRRSRIHQAAASLGDDVAKFCHCHSWNGTSIFGVR